MRVGVVETLPRQDKAALADFSDVSVERALKSFLAAVGTEDSLFVAEPEGIQLEGGDSGEKVCAGTIRLKFRDEKMAGNRATHFFLLDRLSELLRQAGSTESLRALLCLRAAGEQEGKFAIIVSLEATGASTEQAGLRWGLGLAHVQQALLFTSRSLRQQLMQGGN